MRCILLLLAIMKVTTFVHPQDNWHSSPYDLHFDHLPMTWDEGIPLGNGIMGALIWQKDNKLRISLDRADLWDLRPMENLDRPEWRFSWVCDQWLRNNYSPVQEYFDWPYDKNPAPSKIPGAALELDISSLGEMHYVHLYIQQAVCEIKWRSGVSMQIFMHATDPIGWLAFSGLSASLSFDLITPPYHVTGQSDEVDPVTGQDLRRLQYPAGTIEKRPGAITYDQEGWGGFSYQVHLLHEQKEGTMQLCWSISADHPGEQVKAKAKEVLPKAFTNGRNTALASHVAWWNDFWSKSSISVPNHILEKQWYLEQYKFGSVARQGAPPISLQAIWTADNGKLPPWKGDFHHDLNTQLSYWPAYSANHLEESLGFIEWLWKNRETFRRYTRTYYECEGLNVPGVTTLTGQPMGGWIQYAFGPTVSAWLGHHFYLQWQYSQDREFLEQRAYPWLSEVATYFEDLSEIGEDGKRKLPLSSSPEIHNNNRDAWFDKTTNFDLALIRWTLEKTSELAVELGKSSEAERWKHFLAEWPFLAVDESTGLMVAPGMAYLESHRHFSHQMGYHPLGLVDVAKGESDQQVIQNTISTLEEAGTGSWTGYSFSWLGNMKARALDGDGAEQALEIFATSFCLPNSFHCNGDQSGKGYSNYTYRPFTLEGNFAFAAGLQEMLIQSHTGVVKLFPAVPQHWEEVSFEQLRAVGAFLLSAKKAEGEVKTAQITSTAGGTITIQNPFSAQFDCSRPYEMSSAGRITINTQPNEVIHLTSR